MSDALAECLREVAGLTPGAGWRRRCRVAPTLAIVGRKEDMIVVFGFNVCPNEVEDCLPAHPGVLEVAAIGLPGEAVKAFIVRRGLSVNDAEIRHRCRSILVADKIARHGVSRGDLRKSNAGRIPRTELRAPPFAELAAESA